jgi:DnaK suppressor protein
MLTDEDRARYRRRLTERLHQLYARVHEDLRRLRARPDPGIDNPLQADEADDAEATDLGDLCARTSERNLQLAQEIEAALARLDAGTFGLCVDCGREIERARLDAVPWAARCQDDQERADRRTATPSP